MDLVLIVFPFNLHYSREKSFVLEETDYSYMVAVH